VLLMVLSPTGPGVEALLALRQGGSYLPYVTFDWICGYMVIM